MKYRISAALVLVLFLLLSVGTVRADSTSSIAYTLTGPVDATFELPTNFTVPAGNFSLGVGFFVTPLDLMINGSPATGDFLVFYSSSMDGAFGDIDGLFSLTGPQLYTGLESAPSMTDIPGNIALSDFFTGTPGYTLTMTPVSTPEPASLLLMGAGLSSLFLMRRRKVTA
jgi:PEP-CTERM motif